MADVHRRSYLALAVALAAVLTSDLHAQFQPQPPIGPNFGKPNLPPPNFGQPLQQFPNPPIVNPPAFDPKFDGPDFPVGGDLDFFPLPQDNFPPAFMPGQVQPEQGSRMWVYIVAGILGGMFLIAVVTLVTLKACGAF